MSGRVIDVPIQSRYQELVDAAFNSCLSCDRLNKNKKNEVNYENNPYIDPTIYMNVKQEIASERNNDIHVDKTESI